MLQKSKITLWTIFRDSETEVEPYINCLSDAEKNRAGKFRFEKDRLMFILGRGILRQLLGRYTNMLPSEINFSYGEQGKPYLASPDAPYFNISHSGHILVMGFCQEHPLGVDVEEIKTDFDVSPLAEQNFSVKEIEALLSLKKEEQNRGFYRCWTRKESFIKAKGAGLSFPLDAFTVSLDDDDNAEVLETKWNKKEKDAWQLSSFIPSDGYLAAISVQHKNVEIEHQNWPTSRA